LPILNRQSQSAISIGNLDRQSRSAISIGNLNRQSQSAISITSPQSVDPQSPISNPQLTIA
jgi:hypothetical protein